MRFVMLALLFACVGSSTSSPTRGTSSTVSPPTSTLPVFDPATGFERTSDGAVNRVADVPSSPDDYTFGTDDCYGSLSDTEPACVPSACTEHPNGRCASERCLNTWCTCVYACSSDADCAADEACLRPEHGLAAGIEMPQCVPANCRTNDDCPSGECGVSVVSNSDTQQLRLACRTADDICRIDADCEEINAGDLCSGNDLRWGCACSYCWCD